MFSMKAGVLICLACLAMQANAAGPAAGAAACPITNKALYQGYVSGYKFSSPLNQAAFAWDLPRVKCLVEKAKVPINIKDKATGDTPLIDAFQRSQEVYWHPDSKEQTSVIAYLLSKGANPNAVFNAQYWGVSGYTPLHWAAYDGRVDLLKLLVAAGGNVNAVDSRGFTPAHSAARCDFRLSFDDWAYQSIQFLASKGANMLAKDKAGESILDIFTVPPKADFNKPTWPSGTCRKSYFLVQGLIKKAQAAKASGRKL